MKTTTHTLRKLKGQRPIVAVTAYDTITARYASEAGVDVLLVGDSLGNTILGFDNTVPVTLDMMCHHTAAVARANPAALIAADLPFAEAHYDFERVLHACQRLCQESRAEAVKIEASISLSPTLARLTDAGIALWGHLGLRPQQIHTLGRYRKFGVTAEEADTLYADALALEKSGCFALLLEMVVPEVAKQITAQAKIPVIGIGCGPDCDGQILVTTDILGLTPGYVPSFAEKFADAGAAYKSGFTAYTEAIRTKKFPA